MQDIIFNVKLFFGEPKDSGPGEHPVGHRNGVPFYVLGYDRPTIVPASQSGCFGTPLVVSVETGRDGGAFCSIEKSGHPRSMGFKSCLNLLLHANWVLLPSPPCMNLTNMDQCRPTTCRIHRYVFALCHFLVARYI